jgi:predicted RNA-binding protein with PIN domain
MRWLIDGYNVIRRDADLRGAEEGSLHAGREALLRLVAGLAQSSDEHFIVVFDGAPRGSAAPPGRIEVLFSRAPETADDVLIRLARQHREGAVLISSDRTVTHAATRAGCTVLSAEQFLDAAQAGGVGAGRDDRDDEDEDQSPHRGGNPRRPSREERAAQRALGRLRSIRGSMEREP